MFEFFDKDCGCDIVQSSYDSTWLNNTIDSIRYFSGIYLNRVHINIINETNGIIKGVTLASKRLTKCHPIKFLGGSEGYDPVPKKE